ncbi:MAG: hypothetical protein RLZ63_888 [Pseudomonadota bacterium]
MSASRQITLLACETPEIAAFMASLEHQLQQHAPTVNWRVRCMQRPEANPGTDLFLWSHSPEWREASNPQEQQCRATEHACRQALLSSGTAFQVLQGSLAQRMDTVLNSLGLQTDTAAAQSRQFALNGGRTPWRCESCSDPDCEHRLFTGLLSRPNP